MNQDNVVNAEDDGISVSGGDLEIDLFGFLSPAILEPLNCGSQPGRIIIANVDELDGNDFDF